MREAEGGQVKYIRYYGCVECQRDHFEDEGLYKPHLLRQSKHGIKTMSVEYAAKLLKDHGPETEKR
jgi:hypothetical protein